MIVYDIGVDGGNTNDVHYWGQSGGIAAYSIATQACNKGTRVVDWVTAGGSTLHPVIAQNMFRYKDGRFEHIGQSWLKHGFCAVNEAETFCQPCQSTPCSTLGIGCADTYWATLNDGGSGQSKVNINATAGTHVHGGAPSGNATIRGRLQVAVSDMDPAQNPGASYYIEGHYITKDDSDFGNPANNASWRPVSVVSVSSINGGGATRREEPAIFAWQDADRDVAIKQTANIEGSGVKRTYLFGFRVTQLGPKLWHYEYAIQNLNSDQSGRSFSVPVASDVTVSNIGFHDVNYHSGDPYDGTDWPGVRNATEVSWGTTPFATNPNANALRWGTLYNFRFDADAPPVLGTLTMGLFKPSINTSLAMENALVPGEPVIGHPWVNKGNPSGVILPFPITTPPTPAVPRYGSHVNLVILSEGTPAIVGSDWEAELQLAGVKKSYLLFGLGGAAEGTFSPLGELLVRPPMLRGKMNELTLAIPDDPRLVGFQFSAQAAVKTESGWKLSNALDVTIGSN